MTVLSPSSLETMDYGQQGWSDIHNTNMEKINGWWSSSSNIVIIDAFLAAQPGAPSDGDRYIATATAGDWTINNIYTWSDASMSWEETIAYEGLLVYDKDTNFYYSFDGSNWVGVSSLWVLNVTVAELRNLDGRIINSGANDVYFDMQNSNSASTGFQLHLEVDNDVVIENTEIGKDISLQSTQAGNLNLYPGDSGFIRAQSGGSNGVTMAFLDATTGDTTGDGTIVGIDTNLDFFITNQEQGGAITLSAFDDIVLDAGEDIDIDGILVNIDSSLAMTLNSGSGIMTLRHGNNQYAVITPQVGNGGVSRLFLQNNDTGSGDAAGLMFAIDASENGAITNYTSNASLTLSTAGTGNIILDPGGSVSVTEDLAVTSGKTLSVGNGTIDYDGTYFKFAPRGLGGSAANWMFGSTLFGEKDTYPSGPLHLAAAGSGTTRFLFTNDSTGHLNTDGIQIVLTGTNAQIINKSAGYILMGANGANDLYFDGLGQIGLGNITTLTELLDINGNAHIRSTNSLYLGSSKQFEIYHNTDANISTTSGDIILEPAGGVGINLSGTNSLDLITASGSNYFQQRSYSTTDSDAPIHWFFKSASNTAGVKSATADGETLGITYYQGVDSTSNWDTVVKVVVTQDGTTDPDLGGRYAIETQPKGGTLTENFSVESNGDVICGGIMHTALGGIAIKLTNRSGGALTKGRIVEADSSNNDSFTTNAAGGDHPIGVVYDASIADDAEGWIVVSGIADVAYEDNVAAVQGYWVGASSSEAGYAETQAASPGFASGHFDEIGHSIESVAAGGAGTHILGRVVLHFN